MMKKLFILGIVLSVAAVSLRGQNIMMLTGDIDRIIMNPGVICDSVQIDRAELNVRYRFTRLKMQLDEVPVWTDVMMQIGEHIVKQTDLCLYYDNLIFTKNEIGGALSACRKSAGMQPTNLFSEIICDRQTKEMSIMCGDFFHSDVMKKYTQNFPEIFWNLSDGEKTVGGFICKKAIANYGGRKWSVWYTTEIPVSSGPWKLHGLPGLILSATDNEDFSFECLEVRYKEGPIFEYIFDRMQNIGSLKNYLRYERGCHEHPYQTFANGGDAVVIATGADGKVQYLDDDWQIPYNPIELE